MTVGPPLPNTQLTECLPHGRTPLWTRPGVLLLVGLEGGSQESCLAPEAGLVGSQAMHPRSPQFSRKQLPHSQELVAEFSRPGAAADEPSLPLLVS